MKSKIVPIAVFIAILGCVLAVSANVTTSKMHQNLEQERYKRMLAEQQLQKANKTIQALEKEIGQAEEKMGLIENIVNQGESANSNLKKQLDILLAEKESLMEKVQELGGPGASQP